MNYLWFILYLLLGEKFEVFLGFVVMMFVDEVIVEVLVDYGFVSWLYVKVV